MTSKTESLLDEAWRLLMAAPVIEHHETTTKCAVCRWQEEVQAFASRRRAPETLCPHGLPLAENVCGPCSEGRPMRAVETPREHPPELMAVVDKWQDYANSRRDGRLPRYSTDYQTINEILREIRRATVKTTEEPTDDRPGATVSDLPSTSEPNAAS
jgi:hypothetical protein